MPATTTTRVAATAAVAVVAAHAGADVLVYEPFDYATGTSLAGASGGQGFGPGEAWQAGGDTAGSITGSEIVAPLAFGPFINNGNAVEVVSNANTGSYDTFILSRGLGSAVDVAPGSTVWSSFLFNHVQNDSFANASELSLSQSAFGGPRKFRHEVVDLFDSNGPDEVAFGYGDSTVLSDQAVVETDTVYLAIAKFENVNGAGSHDATLWILDEAGFTAIAPGGVTEAELAANSLTSVVDMATGVTLGSDDFVQLQVTTNFGTNNRTVFDEVRLFETLGDFNAAAIPGSPGLPGDANGDGTVDLADFGILRSEFGMGGGMLLADFNDDGTVDLADFGILRANFGSSADVGALDAWYATVVPEPASLALAGLAGAGLLRRRR